MNVTLVTEGTYPHAYGGVSVWCDQLVRGMPEHAFHVVALTGTGEEALAWDPPVNVTVEPVPLWGPRPPGRGGSPGEFEGPFRVLLDLCLGGGTEAAGEIFPSVLRSLYDEGGLSEKLAGEGPVVWLMEAWGRRDRDGELPDGVRPNVHDALTAISLLEHALRPLARPVPAADLTHAVSNGATVLPALAAKWTHGTPFCLTEHGIYLRERYLGYGKGYSWPVKQLILAFLRMLCAAGYQAADLITPGNRYNQRWETRCGADPELIRTVYNGVNPEEFPEAGSEPERLTMSWAGRVDPIKDLETLIKAFAIVRDEFPNVVLRLFGGGNAEYREKCVALAGDLDVEEHVTFEGRVEEVRDAYVAGTIVMLSSISEGFPYTLIEAMTCGRATVSTDVGGVTEAVAANPNSPEDGDCGLVVPPRDPEAMAEAAVRLLRDPDLRARMGGTARRKALEFFTVDQAVASFRQIYDEMAGARVS